MDKLLLYNGITLVASIYYLFSGCFIVNFTYLRFDLICTLIVPIITILFASWMIHPEYQVFKS